jgi:hypothetical protein
MPMVEKCKVTLEGGWGGGGVLPGVKIYEFFFKTHLFLYMLDIVGNKNNTNILNAFPMIP